ncbi:hypothetical protein ONZ45_g7230 [Pleurotus djamor]|nr:hypothetical protein ONZ45_g7230 [Pleurotus djamor]
MSAFFPHVNLDALKTFAIATAAKEHQVRKPIVGAHSSHEIQPRILGCNDVHWGGDNMIMITFDPESVPLGPRSMMAHFPRGRPHLTTQALVGMTARMRSHPLDLVVPQVYAFIDYLPNDIGAEVVLLQKIGGVPLDEVWPELSTKDQQVVILKVAEILLAMFNHRGGEINTEIQGSPRGMQQMRATVQENTALLLAPAFDQGPLVTLPPQRALRSNEEYLRALAARVERVFSSPQASEMARSAGDGDRPRLSDQDVERIRETWKRMAMLIPFHAGGFYLPSDLPLQASNAARSVLQSPNFGIYHSDMRMSRFMVDIRVYSAPTPTDPHARVADVVVGLTGWEHAHRAPLWSCARMPKWLYPNINPDQVVPWERQAYIRNVIVLFMTQKCPLRDSWQWVAAYVFGTTERWFEGCLSSHWRFRDTLELLLTRLKVNWQHRNPPVGFPLLVGAEYAAIASVIAESVEEGKTEPDGSAAVSKRKKKGKARGT